MAYDPDRIKVPMKRTNPEKGKGIDPKFVPITWDEALNTIADKMIELRNNNETHKFMLMRGRYGFHNSIMYDAFPKIFGSPNNISHSSICAEAEKAGPMFTQGYWNYRDYDFDKMKYLILWGVDPIRSNRLVPGIVNKFGGMLDRMKIVTIDPLFTAAAAKSHDWLPVIPGQDGALASAMAHVILTEGIWNKEFVGDFLGGANKFVADTIVDEADFEEKHTNGVVKWWNIELKNKSAEWAEPICGIKASKIKEIAIEIAYQGARTGVWLGPGPVMKPRGTYTAMAIHALNGLLGNIDHEGGVVTGPSLSTASAPSFTNYQDEVALAGVKFPKIDQRGTLTFPAMASGNPGSGVVTGNVANGVLAENPYDIKVAIGYWCNFNFSITETERWDKAMAKVPFFAHIVTQPSEMTQFADIVLPAALHATETWNFISIKGNLHTNVSIQQPIGKRYFDAKADETEIMWLLSEKLKDKGFSNFFDYLQNEYVDPDNQAKATNADEFAIYATKFRTKPVYDKIGGWEKFKEIGVVNSDRFTFGKLIDNFPTATKKFEFYSETIKKSLQTHADKHQATIDHVLESCNYEARGELAFVPHYESPKRWGSREEYPLDFIDAKSRYNREGRSQNVNIYYEFKRCDPGDENHEDVIKINPKDAIKFGISNGDMVRVTSVLNSFEGKVKLWEGIQPGTLSKTFGQGHWAYGRTASADYSKAIQRGANNNDIMPDDYDRLSGSTSRNGGFTGVKIEKI
jgi:anaerobic selenocysteine-containing dehydrogenase